MQKYILCILMPIIGTGAAITAIANNVEPEQTRSAMKVATITKMYQQDVNNEGMDYPLVLQQYDSPELQAAFQLEQDYFDREQMSCNIDHDVLWDSQDPDYEQDRQFTVTAQGVVKVSLAQGDIYYELSCDDACQVSDVILNDDRSLKDYLIEACR